MFPGDIMIALKLRDLREDRDLTQKAVAALLQVHQTTYSDYELGSLYSQLGLEGKSDTVSLYGKTIGIVGFGNIGRRLCELVYGMKAGRVVYYDAFRASPETERSLNAEYMELDDLLRVSDVVSLHLPLNEGTRHIVNAEKLALMKPDAILINTARGAIVDEAALVEVLKARRIRGAGLDTFDPEPPAPDNPFFALDNVVLTSHGAGAVFENIPPRVQHVYDCIVKFEKGEPVDERFVIVRRAAK